CRSLDVELWLIVDQVCQPEQPALPHAVAECPVYGPTSLGRLTQRSSHAGSSVFGQAAYRNFLPILEPGTLPCIRQTLQGPRKGDGLLPLAYLLDIDRGGSPRLLEESSIEIAIGVE